MTDDDLTTAEGFYDLRLFVAGQSPKSIRAIENLRRVCDEHLKDRYRIEVIDLMENPTLARKTKSSPCPP